MYTRFLGRTIWALLVFFLSFRAQAQIQVRTEIYPAVELLNVIHLLSDSVETVPSTYAIDVRRQFQAFKDHPAVQKAREMALINCDFPLRHSWCFYNFPDVQLHLPDTLWAYNKYVTTVAVRDYFKACMDFYRDSRFWEFFTAYRPKYDQWIQSFNRNLYEDGMLAAMDSLYRLKPSNKVVFTLGAMNCNSFALPETGDINPAFKGISTIFIAFGNLHRSKDTIAPAFYSPFNSQLIWHEAGHVYLADLFCKYEKEVMAIQDIFNNSEDMKREAGAVGWAHYLDENITQAVTSYLRIRAGVVAKDVEYKRMKGYYILSEAIIGIMEDQYINKPAYADFDAFFPVLLRSLAERARGR